ncbi:Fungal specific transcription factor domain [Ceratobasidium sp. AG-Ba]|nr:Fungal specific transcription factor domain [Ceratobasidium sp. AG-Ba]QRW07178.1 Fungal specific transcription factor domain [Ceratobasidium sp. AG-Ba]
MECLGYAHLDNAAPQTRRSRNKSRPSPPLEHSSTTLRQLSDHASVQLPAIYTSAPSNPYLPPQDHSAFVAGAWSLLDSSDNSGRSQLLDDFHDTAWSLDGPGPVPNDVQDPPLLWSDIGFGLPGASLAYLDESPSDESSPSNSTAQPSHSIPPEFLFPETPGTSVALQRELLDFNSSQADTTLVKSISSKHSNPQDLLWAPHDVEHGDETEDYDTEGVMNFVGPTLALDPTNPSNALPFILSSYFRWIMRTLFEPLKIVPGKRDQLIQRYSYSDDSRCATMLVAIIMESLDKNPVPSYDKFPAMKALEDRVSNQLALVKSRPKVPYACDVLTALHDLHEMISLQCITRRASDIVKILDQAAPIYRQARPEPPGAPLRLAAILLDPVSILRHFPSMDILIGFNTGRPMHFRYETACGPELNQAPTDLDLAGLQWMNGVPDRFLILLARLNMMLEDSVPNIDARIIQGLELEIADFRPVLDESPDPYMKVARLMVYEVWRQVMYIYLYMGICGAASNDPRVENALKKVIRLLAGVKPGRMPDMFLVLPLSTAGVAAHRQCDRDIIRRRILGVPGCSQLGTAGNDAIRILDDIWNMCNVRGRYAKWIDLRTATSRVTGII